MLTWLPTAPNFRADLSTALECNAADRLEKLTSLAQNQLSYLETLQIDRALARPTFGSETGFTSVRLAVLASSTVSHLLPSIRVAGLRRRLHTDVHVGRCGQYRQELLDNNSTLHQFASQFVLFATFAANTSTRVALTATAAEVDKTIRQSIEELRLLWRKASATSNATIVQRTFLNTAEPVFGSYDRLVPGAPARVIAQLNEPLWKAELQGGVLLLGVARSSEREGLAAWFDTASWLQGKLEISPPASIIYGEMVARIISAQRELSKKCLVLDLDNTLWGGVVGDDGVEGLILGEGSAVGEAHLALQRSAKQLKERGVIGLDSLVFVDDNPVERARIRQSLPMVAVPELPNDVANYVRCLAVRTSRDRFEVLGPIRPVGHKSRNILSSEKHLRVVAERGFRNRRIVLGADGQDDAGYFGAVSFTSEDRQRAEQYATNAEREALFEPSGSLEDFLKGLHMSVVVGKFNPVNFARVTQLFKKTNQFNTTTRRYASRRWRALRPRRSHCNADSWTNTATMVLSVP
jgi:predicted enzyme involved in methoxymalonyl-ACP biosynthesis